VSNAHYNLIRVIISLESVKHRYFVTADVCGIVKVWSSTFKPAAVIDIDLEQAMSYNSLIELTGVLPENAETFQDTSLIACALKSQKVHLIMLSPQSSCASGQTQGQGSYQILRTLMTES
jgi:hypothetical protein